MYLHTRVTQAARVQIRSQKESSLSQELSSVLDYILVQVFFFFFGFLGGVSAALRSALHAWKCFYKGEVKESWFYPLSQSEQLMSTRT